MRSFRSCIDFVHRGVHSTVSDDDDDDDDDDDGGVREGGLQGLRGEGRSERGERGGLRGLGRISHPSWHPSGRI